MSGYEAQFLPPLPDKSETTDSPWHFDRFSELLNTLAEHHTGLKGSKAVIRRPESDEIVRLIIAGNEAARQLDAGEELDPGARAKLKDLVHEGNVAQRGILEVTARLGRRIGMNSMGTYFSDNWQPLGGSGWGLSHLANLASPYADMEDRVQNAIYGVVESLPRYIEHFKQLEKEGNLRSLAEFATVVMYGSRGAVRHGIDSAWIRETLGARVKRTGLKAVNDAMNEYKTGHLSLVTREQAKTKQRYDQVLELQDMLEAGLHTPWYEVAFPYSAPEEAAPEVFAFSEDDEGELQEGAIAAALPPFIEDVYPDPNWRAMFETVESGIARQQRQHLFQELLTDRQLLVLALHNGFSIGDHAAGEYTLKHLGEMMGIDSAGAARYEQRATQRLLRLPEDKVKALRESLWGSVATGEIAQAFSGDRLRTGIRTSKPDYWHKSVQPLQLEEARPRWMRHLDGTPAAAETVRGTKAYDLVYRSLAKAMYSAVQELAIDGADARRTPYPRHIHDKLETYLGDRLSVQHVEDFWNHQAGLLLQQHDKNGAPVQPNRLGQLVSRLLADRMQDADIVTLYIPEGASGRCGYLGAWASQGEITIIGDAGDYIGMHMKGLATITVDGGVGDFAGAFGSEMSHLEAEHACRNAGYKLRGWSEVVLRQDARFPIAQGLMQAAQVRVDEFSWGEGAAHYYKQPAQTEFFIPSHSSNVPPSQRVTLRPATEEDIEASLARKRRRRRFRPSWQREQPELTLRPSAASEPVSEQPPEPESEPSDQPEPAALAAPSPPFAEETASKAEEVPPEEEVLAQLTPVQEQEPESVTPPPDEPEPVLGPVSGTPHTPELPPEPEEEALSWNSAAVEASTSQLASSDMPVQTIDFDEAAGYLGLTPDQLQVYTEQTEHQGRTPLTVQEFTALVHRFPELA